jgi:hypothetical protein
MNPPVAAAFDIQNALKLVDTAAQTYSPVPPRGGAVIFSRATDTRALVFADADDAVIAFRGTADLRNWLTDLQCDLRPWRSAHARVHHGFLAAWRSIRDETIQTVEDLGPKRRLWLTGHSLGGALAMLAALELKSVASNAANLAGCYTFGQPRVGNADFRDWFNAVLRDKTFRVVHSDDIVARVPWLLGSYHHAGHEIFFPNAVFPRFGVTPPSTTLNLELGTLNYRVNPSIWAKLPSDLIGLARAWFSGFDALLADHYVRSYINLLARSPAGPIRNPTPKPQL